ncbi:MAG: hypothetical protein U0573_13395 [Phycisphaerales bacterium]|nr:hypothetical protein [Planctomycetota bacterium]
MSRSIRALLAAAAAGVVSVSALAGPVGSNFSYQGRLTENGAPANGIYDIQALLFNASAGGAQQGLTQSFNNVSVSNGVFTLDVDFGSQFSGEERWVELRIRPGASVGAYTTISPRTEIAATPYAQALKLPVNETGNVTNGLMTFTNTNSVGGNAWVFKGITGAPSGNYPVGFYEPVIVADTNTGNGIFALSSASGAYSIYAVKSGSGGNALYATNSGTSGRAAFFTTTDSTNSSNAVEISTNGNSTSQALRSVHSGLGDNALFEITNASNQGEAVEAHTVGTGNAGYFQIDNTDSNSAAAYATTNGSGGIAVQGAATGSSSYGVKGTGLSAGVRGECGTTNGAGVWGFSNAGGNGGGSGVPAGVRGDAQSPGVAGGAFFNNSGTGVYAQSTSGTAGFFSGNVTITGSLSKGSGSFKIDHPLDPANKFLYHSFVESPDMMNVYTGTAKIGEDGTAVVSLPSYFGALNIDYHYQLTCVGGYAQVYVAEEVKDNQFKIAGGRPGMKVSWQVTGTRNDAYARYHRVPVETEKAPEDRGMYLAPEAFGFDQSRQIGTRTGATGVEKRIN